MFHPTSYALLPIIVAGLIATGCGDDDRTPAPSDPTPPTAITETFSGTVTVNGAVTNPFSNTRAGIISARLTSLSVEGAVVGLSLGTWNGQVCQIILANDNATVSSGVTGSATVGAFCVRVYDVGKLTRSVDYEVTVEHY